MACVLCQVRPDDVGAWVTCFAEHERGPYLTSDMALRVAVADALSVRRAGDDVRISVMDRGGENRAEVCLCARFEQSLAVRAALAAVPST
jgi:hypothetical protein